MTDIIREKVEREFRILTSLSGLSGIVNVLNQVEDSDHYYTVLEACTGTVWVSKSFVV